MCQVSGKNKSSKVGSKIEIGVCVIKILFRDVVPINKHICLIQASEIFSKKSG